MVLRSPDHHEHDLRDTAELKLAQLQGAHLPHYSDTMQNEERISYDWHEASELTPEMIQLTHRGYNRGAVLYSQKEWSPESIKTVWEKVFKHPIMEAKIAEFGDTRLYPELQVLFGGAGSLKDTLTMGLISSRSRVYAYDKSPAMRREGEKKITWQYLVSLSQVILELNPNANGYIAKLGGLHKKAQDLAREIIEVVSEQLPYLSSLEDLNGQLNVLDESFQALFSELTEEIINHIYIFTADHLGFSDEFLIPEGDFNLIFDIATLQHLTKPHLEQAIGLKLSNLAVGGMYHFNLRLDEVGVADRKQPNQRRGRVFSDTELGANAERFYNTMTQDEINQLVRQIMDGTLNLPEELVVKLQDKQFVVSVGNISAHPNGNKPGFVDIFVERIS